MKQRERRDKLRRLSPVFFTTGAMFLLIAQIAWAGLLPQLGFYLQTNVSLLAGYIWGTGNIDGVGIAAGMGYPYGTAVDSSGNVYVADAGNHQIRKVSPSGVVTTIAGSGSSGSSDGTGTAASFNWPEDVGVDSSGNIFVADTYNHTIRKITPAGVVTTFAGTAGISGTADGTGSAARFWGPEGLAVDSAGNVFVADSGSNTIRKITPAGVVTTFAGSNTVSGSTDATGTAARFSYPTSIAIDSSGNLYVADTSNFTVRKITSAAVVTTLAGSAGLRGSVDATGSAARFGYPQGIGVDSSGNVFVGDTDYYTIRKVTPAGVVTTFAGTSGAWGNVDGTGAAANFAYPRSTDVDASGNIYVADADNYCIRKITSAGAVTTFAGSSAKYGTTDGTGAAAGFRNPQGIAIDSTGNIYVADSSNNTIRKVTTNGVVTTFAGTAGASGTTDGTGVAARFAGPIGLTLDSTGNLYVADTSNHTIRKITSAGVVTTFAGGAGLTGTTNGTGTAARFYNPFGVTIDSSGNLFVADAANYTIRKITPAGAVTTFAGGAGVSGSTDGTGTAARFNYPYSLTIDGSANLYVADTYNHTIRKITSAGVVTTLAGSAGSYGSTDGTGSAARFLNPSGITIDSSGNLYVADQGNHTIRKVTPAGVVTTILGKAGRVGTFLGPTNSAQSSLGDLFAIAFVPSRLVFTINNGLGMAPLR
jgi:hypothetical protein